MKMAPNIQTVFVIGQTELLTELSGVSGTRQDGQGLLCPKIKFSFFRKKIVTLSPVSGVGGNTFNLVGDTS